MDDARQKCLELGGALPIPRSDVEQADLHETMNHFGLVGLGIIFESSGFSKDDDFKLIKSFKSLALDAYEKSSGVYVDSVGNPLTYFAWGSVGTTEPNNPMTEQYVVMYPSHNFEWADIVAAHLQNVVCVKCHPGYYRGSRNFLYNLLDSA